MLFGGRGSGKTEGATREFNRRMRAQKLRARIIGPTLGDIIESCVEGDSGILAMDPQVRFLASAPGGAQLQWPNGSRARLIGTPTPRDVERLRAAGNVHLDWWEELAANPQLEKAWTQAALGNRLGPHPLAIASTTPRVRKFLKQLMGRRTTVITHGRMDDNPHLSDMFREEMRDMYGGTRIGRQEIEGELLEDIEGALWQIRLIDIAREQWELAVTDMGGKPPRFRRVVVGVDPNASEHGAECGIVVCAAHVDGKRGAVLDDQSVGSATPDAWARAAVQAYWDWEADCIAAEVNNGGDMVVHTIRTVDPRVRVKQVRATRGKQLRAEPVVALYEQGRVMHRQRMPILEDQMTTWTPDQESPDRLDALVWGLTEVMGLGARKAAPMRAY
jgi:phage terminase large subunit-like protein